MVARTDGPFEYWEVTGDAVRAAAEKPGSDAAVIQSLAGELEGDETRAANSIEGDIEAGVTANTTAARTTAQNLAAKGQYAVGLLNQFGADVDTFDTTVNQINIDYKARYDSTIFGMHHQPEYRSGEEKIDYAAVAASIKADLMARYHKAEGVIDDAADEIASMFKQGPTDENVRDLIRAGLIPLSAAGLYPSLVLTDDDKRQALKAAIKGMTPEQQAQYVKDHKEIDANTASVISPEAQTILANDVAKDVEDNDIDAETVRIMGLLKDQAPFAHAFYSKVSPDEIADAIRVMSNETYPPGSTPPLDQFQRAEVYKGFLDAAGVTFATYTKGTGEYAPPSDLANTWFKAITDDTNPENAAALTMLIKHGGHEASFEPDFLSDVTDKVYDWERSHDGDPVWGPLNDKLGQYYGIKDPTLDYGDKDDPYDNYTGYKTPYDGLANLLSGMEKTPQAAEQFFDDPATADYHDQKVNDKLHYLLTDRRWPTDDGDGFGIALEGATLHSRDGGDGNPDTWTAGEKSARLASQAMFIIGHEVGEGDSWRPGDDGWQIPHGMTDSVGKIVGGYMPDLYRVAQGNGDDIHGNDWIWGDSEGEGGRKGSPLGMLVSNDDMEKVLQSLGRGDDKTGMQYVTTAALDYHNELNGDLIDKARMPDGSKPQSIADLRESNLDSLLNDEAARGGKNLSFIMQNGFLGGKAEEAASQEERDAIAKAFGVATEFVPTPQGKIAGLITSEGMSMIGDQLGEQPDSVTQKWAEDSDQAIKDSLNFQTYNTLLNHGFLDSGDPAGIPADAVKTDAHGHKYIDPHLYNGDSDDVDPVTQKEFNTWLSNQAIAGLGQSSINAYSSNMPNFSG